MVNSWRLILDQLKSELHTVVILLAAVNDSKVTLITGVTNNCLDKINAVDFINKVAIQLGGKVGGRADMVKLEQNTQRKIDDALSSVLPWIKEKINIMAILVQKIWWYIGAILIA